MDYCTVAHLREALSDSASSLPEALLQRAVSAASRAVDSWCGVPPATFAPQATATPRLYYATCPERLDVDAFGSMDGLTVATDEDGDGVCETEWSAEDFIPGPLNADGYGVPYAWQWLTAAGRRWPVGTLRPGVRVTARWGWSEVPEDIRTATIIRATAIFKRKEAPYGVAEFGEFGPVRISRNDPDVVALLTPYRRVVVA